MYRKNTAGQFIHFQGVDTTNGAIKSGVSWTIRRCIDGTFAAGGGTVTEDGTTGWYKCALSQADTNGNDIGFNFTGTGAVPQTINIITTAADPTDAVHFGLSSLPNTAVTGNASLLTSGTGADQLSVAAGLVNIVAATRPGIRKNTALPKFEIVMTDSTNHNPATGKTVSVTRSVDGGAFASGTLVNMTELANGVYYFDWGAGDLNGDIIMLRATAAGCDDLLLLIRTNP